MRHFIQSIRNISALVNGDCIHWIIAFIFEAPNEKLTLWRYKGLTHTWHTPWAHHAQPVWPSITSKCLHSGLHVGGNWAASRFTDVNLNLFPDRIGTDSANFARVPSWRGNCWNNFCSVHTKCYKWNKFNKRFKAHGKLIIYSVLRECQPFKISPQRYR